MKKLTLFVIGCFLTVTLSALAEPKEADQKWLKAVEEMVVKGEKRISTPSEERVNLLKKWAGKEGYSVQVTRTEKGYSIEVSKSIAQK